jgi:hypothetical protein
LSGENEQALSQQKRPHKTYTPKFFHCDDVPRQTISSGAVELASAMKTFLTMGLVHSKPEECDMTRTIVIIQLSV